MTCAKTSGISPPNVEPDVVFVQQTRTCGVRSIDQSVRLNIFCEILQLIS